MLSNVNTQHFGDGHLADLAPPAEPLKSLAEAKSLSEALVAAAQAVYDEWDESDFDTYAGGGICHLIADELVRILDTADVEASSVSSTHEQHVFAACKLVEGVFALDIPCYIYERGAAFTWSKVAGVKFDSSCLVWYRVDADPEGFEAYLE